MPSIFLNDADLSRGRSYDVVKPGVRDQWGTDPFKLTGLDGWLYGRGEDDAQYTFFRARFLNNGRFGNRRL
jgi:hypothetical protein